MKLNIKKNIERGLLLLVFLLPFNFRHIFNFASTQDIQYFKENLQYSLFAFDIVFLITLFFWLLKKKTAKINWAFILLATYLVANSLIVSPDPNTSLYNSLRFVEVLIFFLIIISVTYSQKFFKKTLYVIFISGVFQSAIALLQFAFQKSLGLKYLGESVLSPQIPGVAKLSLPGEKLIRAYGTFPHPNTLGAFLFMSLIAGLYFALKRDWKIPFSFPQKSKVLRLKKKTKRLLGKIHFTIGLALIFTGTVAAFSRSVWLVTALLTIVLVLELFIFNKYRFKSVFKSVFLTIFILGSAFFLFREFIPARLCAGNCQDESLTLRQDYSQFSQKIIVSNPLTGIGIGQFVPVFKEKNPSNLENWDLQPVHNFYLIAWSETGLIGFILIFFFFFNKFNFANPIPCLETRLFFFLASGFLILGLFDHYFWTLPQGQFIFWLSLALFVASGKINE